MAIDVAQWLHGLGLGQYAATFARNDVDGSILLELTAEDLVSLGVSSVGHRRRMLSAIAGLRDGRQAVVLNAPDVGSAGEAAPGREAARRSPLGSDRFRAAP